MGVSFQKRKRRSSAFTEEEEKPDLTVRFHA